MSLSSQIYPLTNSQRGIYYECINDPNSVKYNIPIVHRLPKKTNIEKFIKAVKTALSNHKIFFVKIIAPKGEPMMAFCDFKFEIPIKKVKSFDEEFSSFVKPFDLENGPLFYGEILDINGEFIFFYDVHHIIYDGTSVKNFFDEIVAVYNGNKIDGEDMSIFDLSKLEQLPIEENRKAKYEEFFVRNPL